MSMCTQCRQPLPTPHLECLTKIPLTAELLYSRLRAQGTSDYVRVLSMLTRGQLAGYMAERYGYLVPELSNDNQGLYVFIGELIREFQRVEVSCSFHDLVERAWTRYLGTRQSSPAITIGEVIAFVAGQSSDSRALLARALYDGDPLAHISREMKGTAAYRLDLKLWDLRRKWSGLYQQESNVTPNTVADTLLRAIKEVYL